MIAIVGTLFTMPVMANNFNPPTGWSHIPNYSVYGYEYNGRVEHILEIYYPDGVVPNPDNLMIFYKYPLGQWQMELGNHEESMKILNKLMIDVEFSLVPDLPGNHYAFGIPTTFCTLIGHDWDDANNWTIFYKNNAYSANPNEEIYYVGEVAQITVNVIGDAIGAAIKTETGGFFAQTSQYSIPSTGAKQFVLYWELGAVGTRNVHVRVYFSGGEHQDVPFTLQVKPTVKSVVVANPNVPLNDWAWMTIVTTPDITNLWITNQTQQPNSAVFEIINTYSVGNNLKGWDVKWKLGATGYRTGWAYGSTNDGQTHGISFNVTCY